MSLNLQRFFDSELAEHRPWPPLQRPRCVRRSRAWRRRAPCRSGTALPFFGTRQRRGRTAPATESSSRSRAPIAAIALTTDSSALTAIGNDFGFEHLFARQIAALGKPGDVAIGISTGASPNVLKGLSWPGRWVGGRLAFRDAKAAA